VASRLDQELAVLAAQALPPTVDKTLRSRMRSLSPMIQASGLAATCAFLLSRAKRQASADPYWRTAKALLDAAAAAANVRVDSDPRMTLDNVVRATGHQYLMAEARAAALAGWLSRLAAARAGDDSGDGGGSGGSDRGGDAR
jgi:CRISPR-associated protein Cmr5